MNKIRLVRCACLLLLLISAGAAQPAVFDIANGDIAGLKAALNAANTNGVSDTINLAAGGTYTLTTVDNSVSGPNGLPQISDDVAGVDLIINGNGARIQRSSAPGIPLFRILEVGSGARLDCSGLTIANGKLSGSAVPNSVGGGIYFSGEALNLTGCTITANSAASGAGIYTTGAILLTSCSVTENICPATGEGGGIWNNGQLTLVDSWLNLNTAGSGGGIWNLAQATLRNSTVSNNSAVNGGGIENLSTGSLTLLGCTLSRNTASERGGALINISGAMEIRCTTFAFNSAPDGLHGGAGAIQYNSGNINDPAIILSNNIFQQGMSGPNFATAGGPIVSQGHNLSSDGAGASGSSTGPGGLLNAFGDIRNTNANLGPLQNNGGSTLTHAPVFPSAAIDSGDDSVLGAPLGLTTDQRGTGFARLRGPHVDVGALESGVALVVTTIDDHDDGSCTAADCTLREAITAANTAGSADVSFSPGLTGTVQLSSALPNVSANLLLQGPGPNLLAVRRNSGGDYRIFTISNGSITGPVVSLQGITISNGRAEQNESGGGIYNGTGSLTLQQCAVVGNHTANFGGGIVNSEGTLYLEGCTVAGNAARDGGGIASVNTLQRERRSYFYNSTISGNTAEGGNGGGIYSTAQNSGSIADSLLVNCTLSGNSAMPLGFNGGTGGAIFNGGSSSGNASLSLDDCTVAGNSAPNTGGIYNNNFTATAAVALQNTILKNGATGGNLLSSGQINSLGHNLADDVTGDATNTGTGPGGYLNAPSDIRNTDPLLGPLQDNGGLTFTRALLMGSAAINAGEDTVDSEIDQRGYLLVGTNDIGAFEFGAAVPSIPILSAVSRKVHGTAGSFDINLPQSGPLGIECRSGGAGGNHQLIVTFANPVSVGGVSVTSINGLAHATKSVSANVVTINLSGVANAQALMITLSDVNNGETIGTTAIPMGVLFGDTTGNGAVSSSDISQTKLASGQAITNARFRNDFNLSGSINASDVSAVKLSSGTALP
jgi:CSLREA domain-containing protein